METPRTCARCGTVIGPYAPEGLCAECLLRDGFRERPEDTRSATPELPHDGSAAPRLAEEGTRFFGDYELLERIAQGGMGIVVKARHLKLDRVVALKMLLLGPQASAESVRRFQVEVLAAASLQHPNIVAIHEVGFREGQHFFTMDFVNGQTLAALGQGKPLPATRAARYVEAIAKAIHYAHQRGVLHRDLKPSNVLIDEHDQPRVTDFGLAKRLEGESGLTLSGQVLGTPNYLPPEQAGGRRQDVGRASDVYALGAILYFLLTGRPPFMGETLETTLGQVMHQEPVSPRLLNGSVPRDLETICLKCLEKEPSRRYATAQALADELGRFLHGEPILARPVSVAGKVWRWCRREPVRAGLVAALLLVFSLGLGGVLWQWHRATQIARAEEQQRRRAERETQRAEAGERLAHQRAYASDMKAAQVALQQNNRSMVVDLLQRYLPKEGAEDLRGIEWRYLWQESRGNELMTLPHPSKVNCASSSPDGRSLATCAMDGRIRIWDVASRRTIQEIEKGLRSGFRSVAYSPNGQWLAMALEDQIQIRETLQGRVVRALKPAAALLGFSVDGCRLAAVGADAVRVWDLADWGCHVLTNAFADYGNLALSPDGLQVAYCPAHPGSGILAPIQLWDIASGSTSALGGDDSTVSLAISPDQKWLVSGTWNGFICLWDLAARRLAARFRAHRGLVFAVAFSPDGRMLATGGNDQLIQFWEPGTWKRLGRRQGHGDEIWSLEFSRDGQRLVSSSKDGTAKLWNARLDPAGSLPIGSSPDALLLGPVPNGNALLTLNDAVVAGTLSSAHSVASEAQRSANPAPMAQLWSLASGEMIRSFNRQDFARHGCSRVKFFPGNQVVVGVSPQGAVHFWNLLTGEHLRSVPLAGTGFVPFCLSGDNRWLVGLLEDKSAVLCDLHTARRCQRLPGFFWRGYPADFSPDGRWLACAASDHTIRIWDVPANQGHATLRGHGWQVWSLRFSPDGRLLASADWEGDVRLWSAGTWAAFGSPLVGHRSSAGPVAFSADNKTLVSGGDDQTLRWWHVATGKEMLWFEDVWITDPWALSQAVFNPGGNLVAWQERAGPIRVTQLPTLAEIDLIEKASSQEP